jgi:hypothetical protein
VIREGRRELRRSRRTPKRNAAWIALASGGSHIPCVLWDISETGARIAAARADVLPIAFNLLLTKDGAARRVCRVVWRKEGYMGVQFVNGASADDVLESGALRRLPKVIVHDSGQAACGDAAALLLPGYGPQFLEKPERRGIPISSFAAVMLFMLIAATLLFVIAGMQQELGTAWAQELCDNTARFCRHPEWTGVAGALMAVIYLAARGMEL